MQRRSRILRDAGQGLERIRQAICSDPVLCRHLDDIVAGKAIEFLLIGASELTAEADSVDRLISRRSSR